LASDVTPLVFIVSAPLYMLVYLSKLSNLVCESCQLGKHSCNSFPRSVSHKASSPFALFHFDIWGPSRITSTLSFQYFVTFIEDY